MREIILAARGNAFPMGLCRRFGPLACLVIALSLSLGGCGGGGGGTPVTPATPTLLSITGNGTATLSVPEFRFNLPSYNAATKTSTYHIGSTVRFSVPYPTSIELSIQDVPHQNGQPLTKSEPPLSTNYEYAGRIENPGANPAIWSVDILTPFDVPFAQDPGGQVSYVLSIVDVSGSNRSQPLKIYYRQPQAYIPQIITGTTSSTTTNPTSASRTSGPCPGGGQEQSFLICWRKSGSSPYTAGTTACSYSQAVGLLQNSYPGFTASSGACP